MVLCPQATGHYLSRYWHRATVSFDTMLIHLCRHHRVNMFFFFDQVVSILLFCNWLYYGFHKLTHLNYFIPYINSEIFVIQKYNAIRIIQIFLIWPINCSQPCGRDVSQSFSDLFRIYLEGIIASLYDIGCVRKSSKFRWQFLNRGLRVWSCALNT